MKLLVYPGSQETEVFVRYSSLLKGYDDVILSGPQGWKSPVNFMQKNIYSFEDSLPACDAVLFLETEPQIQRVVFEEKICSAIDAGKRVYLDQNSNYLAGLNIPYEKVEMMGDDIYISKYTEESKVYPIYEIPVPVVFVMGLGPNTGKFAVQLALRKYFLEKGYDISQIGSKRISNFFGFTPFPSIFEDNNLSIRQRMIAFNHYVYQKCMKEHPDVMIVGLPGGVLPLNSLMFEEMGEKALLACQVVRPDAVVLSSYVHPYNQQYFDELSQMCKYRLNFNLRYMAVSSTDISLSSETQKSEYTYITPDIVESQYLSQKNYGDIKLYNIFSDEDMSSLGEAILTELGDNF